MYFSAVHRLLDIVGRSSAMDLQWEYSGRKWRFSTFMRQYLGNGMRYVESYYK